MSIAIAAGLRAPHITIDARMVRASGIGTYIAEIVPRIVALWHEARFTVLGDQGVLAQSIPPSTRVEYRSMDVPIYSMREQLAFARLVPRGTSLLWVPHYNVPLVRKCPLAVTVHDVFHLASGDLGLGKRLYARLMFASIIRGARLVLCDSAFTANELRRLAGEPEAIAVVHLGVSKRWFRLAASSRPIKRSYLLAVGNVKPHKNLKRLVAAFERVAATIPHDLVIVGRRDGLITPDTDVERVAARLGDRVRFTGYTDRAKLEAFVAHCDGLIQPSLYEGFGLPPLEAMAAGRPVAVSRAGSLPEVCGPVADYFDALEVDSIAAALVRLATLAPDAEAETRRRSWVEQFDWDVCARKTQRGLARAAADAGAST